MSKKTIGYLVYPYDPGYVAEVSHGYDYRDQGAPKTTVSIAPYSKKEIPGLKPWSVDGEPPEAQHAVKFFEDAMDTLKDGFYRRHYQRQYGEPTGEMALTEKTAGALSFYDPKAELSSGGFPSHANEHAAGLLDNLQDQQRLRQIFHDMQLKPEQERNYQFELEMPLKTQKPAKLKFIFTAGDVVPSRRITVRAEYEGTLNESEKKSYGKLADRILADAYKLIAADFYDRNKYVYHHQNYHIFGDGGRAQDNIYVTSEGSTILDSNPKDGHFRRIHKIGDHFLSLTGLTFPHKDIGTERIMLESIVKKIASSHDLSKGNPPIDSEFAERCYHNLAMAIEHYAQKHSGDYTAEFMREYVLGTHGATSANSLEDKLAAISRADRLAHTLVAYQGKDLDTRFIDGGRMEDVLEKMIGERRKSLGTMTAKVTIKGEPEITEEPASLAEQARRQDRRQWMKNFALGTAAVLAGKSAESILPEAGGRGRESAVQAMVDALTREGKSDSENLRRKVGEFYESLLHGKMEQAGNTVQTAIAAAAGGATGAWLLGQKEEAPFADALVELMASHLKPRMEAVIDWNTLGEGRRRSGFVDLAQPHAEKTGFAAKEQPPSGEDDDANTPPRRMRAATRPYDPNSR